MPPTNSALPLLAAAALALFPTAPAPAQNAAKAERIAVDARAKTTPFPHFWEQTFGSGRAILALRQSWRDDLSSTKQATSIQSVRFHGIFDDEVGLYDPDAFTKNPGLAAEKLHGVSEYNFSYVDQIYDGMLAQGIRPFVELSFMPKKLSSKPDDVHPFWYHPNVAPPQDYVKWDAMITAFANHLISRYGIAEVSTWHFEVWNEPNLDFWGGRPNMPTYYELYDHTATALKKVSQRLIVGGPATAQAAFVGEFLKHCKDNNIPVDFTSTHVYGNDDAKNIFGTDEKTPRDQMVARAVQKVHQEILSSPFPHMPLIVSEYNASYANEPDVTDTTYMGPWLANNIRLCDGLTESMSYWTFSDVFEEQGVVHTPFYGGFGIIAENNIRKPAFNAFAMLHQLGDQRYRIDSEDALATHAADGSISIALWNYVAPYGEGASYTPPPSDPGAPKTFQVQISGIKPDASVTLWRVDSEHGNVVKAFDRMGRPATPSRAQLVELRGAGTATPPETLSLHDGSLLVTIPAQGLVVLKVNGAGRTTSR